MCVCIRLGHHWWRNMYLNKYRKYFQLVLSNSDTFWGCDSETEWELCDYGISHCLWSSVSVLTNEAGNPKFKACPLPLLPAIENISQRRPRILLASRRNSHPESKSKFCWMQLWTLCVEWSVWISGGPRFYLDESPFSEAKRRERKMIVKGKGKGRLHATDKQKMIS